MENQIKKSLFGRNPVITIIGLIIVIITIIGASSGEKNKNSVQIQTETISTDKMQYEEIFSFSGNGAKKSEPFLIQGSRFKVKYDCKGGATTLCIAFVYKVGNVFPQAIMNSMEAIKDETVIYTNLAGEGEYYIDANIIGSFTMTVEEFK